MAVALNIRSDWTSPEDQLKRLDLTYAAIAENVSAAVSWQIASIVIDYAYVPEPNTTNWYYGLRTLSKLPTKVPPIPLRIVEFINTPCPSLIEYTHKPDGTTYKIREVCTLTLVANTFANLGDFETTLNSHREKLEQDQQDALQLLPEKTNVREVYWDEPFPEMHWQLQTNTALPQSVNKPYADQIKLINTLSQITKLKWETPELTGTLLARTLTRIRTPPGMPLPMSYTRVKEKTDELPLAISEQPNCGGTHIAHSDDYLVYFSRSRNNGMGALVKF